LHVPRTTSWGYGFRARDFVAPRNDGEVVRRSSAHGSMFSRRVAPELCETRPSDIERAQERPGICRYPWSACSKKARGRTTGSANNRPSLRNGLTAYSALSPGTGFLAPVFATMRQRIARASAPGCQDHTAWPCASEPFVGAGLTHAAIRCAHRSPPPRP
jgi:hypothetical protein